ncbi:hypothetical protein MYCTH_95580 [Thermothelomyces thermophilus ATCC 42464]|uniref:Molybdopterin dinucleotide-binding domain-containing protein n=1 Tax=Thermothelomyces thermophilus (strain ATCC 42464 / BCRC 31852 / DSM 1799) TaxID=573729 RepID=G2QIF8_THET4|nr:uncharacterized protein MYCTH_95580 [Thermothelomyces thermophilus ATCC 42464]AEO60332.1 hypothetical protein MYCTH_95580 [Thermothelomyces thermophilus ATCC 42464]
MDFSAPTHQTCDSIKDIWGSRTPYKDEWPTSWKATYSKDRLTYPTVRTNGRLERVSLDEAMEVNIAKPKELNGNTRLCRVTAAASIRESFGYDRQPGSHTDIDYTECFFMPPGECKLDLDIFLECARRMGFKDRDGNDLLPWKTPEEVFEAWKNASAGRPCDYIGLTYELLTGGSGIRWPCNERIPRGTERLYSDGPFPTSIESCERFGHDPKPVHPTAGPTFDRTQGPPFPHETEGRRCKTPCPEPEVRVSEKDAAEAGVSDGDMVVVRSRRGTVELRCRVDRWDPISKQPMFKSDAARLSRLPPSAAATPEVPYIREQHSSALERVGTCGRWMDAEINDLRIFCHGVDGG